MGNRDSKGWHMSLNISFLGSFSAQLSNLIYCCVKFGCGSFVCLSVCLLACLPACLFVCLFLCLFLCLFIKFSFQVSLWRAANLSPVFSLAARRAEISASLSLRGAPFVSKNSPIESFHLWQVPGITTAPPSTESSETF